MALPSLTPEQRAQALERAAEARAARAKVKQSLKSGDTKLSDVLREAETDEALGKMRVSALLESLPGVGKVTAEALLAEVGIAASRRVRGLGARQSEALIERFG